MNKAKGILYFFTIIFGFGAWNIFKIVYRWAGKFSENQLFITILIAVLLAILKYTFILYKFNDKNISKIRESNNKNIFKEIFTLKRLLIILIMISAGVFVRKGLSIAEIYLAPLYLGISIALFISALQYLLNIILRIEN